MINNSINTRLQQLGEYPFARLKALLADSVPPSELDIIDAGVGEPRLPMPSFVAPVLVEHMHGFSKYPPIAGSKGLRSAIAAWLQQRYGLPTVDADTQVITANGTREALYGVAHALVNPDCNEPELVLMPNPMYQIYYGATVLAGASPYLIPCTSASGFAPNLSAVAEATWKKTAMIYLCSPSNPTGWAADIDFFHQVLALAEQYDFNIVSDECYSEIYSKDQPPGLLQACNEQGNHAFRRCLVMNSLSKRSALPGLRSGFIAGDAALISQFVKMRSYSGPATPLPLQQVAAAAWRDEKHVQQNLQTYQQSLLAFKQAYNGNCTLPVASFFIWLPVTDGEAFARKAWAEQAVRLLPGSYLAAQGEDGNNPGEQYVRMALVDGPEKAAELGRRLGKLQQ